MHDKLLCPVFKLIHKPDGWAVLLELWLHAISIAGGQKKNAQLVVSSSKSQKPFLEYTALTPWHVGSSNILVEIFVTWGKKEGMQTLTQPFMITFRNVWKRVILEEGLCLGQKAKPIVMDRQELTPSPQLNLSPLCRWGFLPAVSSHLLGDGRPQLASCFSLTNGNFTVLHQFVVFTSLSLLSSVPELTVWLQQLCGSRTGVCRRSLWAWHHSYHFYTL